MIENLRSAMKDLLEKNEWMDMETIEKAIEKVRIDMSPNLERRLASGSVIVCHLFYRQTKCSRESGTRQK